MSRFRDKKVQTKKLPGKKIPQIKKKNVFFVIKVNYCMEFPFKKMVIFAKFSIFSKMAGKSDFDEIFLGKHILMFFCGQSRISGMSEPPCALKSKFRRQWSKNGLYQFCKNLICGENMAPGQTGFKNNFSKKNLLILSLTPLNIFLISDKLMKCEKLQIRRFLLWVTVKC